MKTRNQIDYIILNQKWKSCVKNVKTRPGADCNSDHQLLAAEIKLQLKKLTQPPQPIRFDYNTLDNNYSVKISNSFEALLQWINDPVEETIYRQQNSKIQRMMRKDKEKFIQEQCQRIEANSINNSTKEMYNGVKNLTKKFKPSVDTIKDEDDLILFPYGQMSSEQEPPPLIDEIREAIKELKHGKSPGNDQVTAERIKNGGENVEIFYHRLCNKIWIENKWPDDWGESVFVPIPKKGDTFKCSSNRTISLISHSSKILLKIMAKRMANKLNEEIADEQAGFRPVAHDILWNDMYSMGFPPHVISLLKALYNQQKAAVRTSYGLTDWFNIGQGVRLRMHCFSSPFNIYSETIMRNALEDYEGGITVGGQKITNLRHADDVVLIAGSMEDLQTLVSKVKAESEKVGLYLNAKKTKVMKCQKDPSDQEILLDGVALDNVTEFTYLEHHSIMETTPKRSKEELVLQRMQTIALSNVWKDRHITLNTKKRLLKSLVFPIASYGSECWVLKTTDRKRLESFELWCYRRVLGISWIEKKTNVEVLQKINIEKRLLDILDERKLSFIGHQVRKHNTLERTLLIGSVYGTRTRGRPKTRLSDNIKEMCGLTMVKLERKAQDRNEWRCFVQRATAVRHRTPRT
ncbi:uncharacterized protein LOC122255792 [Penaeus japonicus]|uniref:uncharacterized protein LOC122255792 n=1 Tax=Penaeus japonicus TaxID=27405 RepID=UPI001C70F6F6|nr:uncharacterized protein LOC122255792 [Penaeus japonicus]